jgi:hypothetical protein
MDDLFSSDCAVDAGNGVLLHDGWVYSHLAGIGGRSCGDTVHQSASSRLRRLFDGRALSGLHSQPLIVSKSSDGILQPLPGSSELSRIILPSPGS